MIPNVYKHLTLLTDKSGVHVSNRPTRDFLALGLAPELIFGCGSHLRYVARSAVKLQLRFPLLPPFAPVQRVVDDRNDFL